jgi:undecaprenyl-phosphate 4-deoxy-4-formamido-L-arabinose transferase
MGFPSLIISIGFGVALIMLSIGVIGEYIYRINLKTTRKPNYFVADKK